jgi:hypothetical protein
MPALSLSLNKALQYLSNWGMHKWNYEKEENERIQKIEIVRILTHVRLLVRRLHAGGWPVVSSIWLFTKEITLSTNLP